MIHVTQALSPFVDWSKIPERKLLFAQERGTAVHGHAATILCGGIPIDVLPEHQGYLDSFGLWLPGVEEIWSVEVDLFCSHYGFQGKPDFIGVWRGTPGVWDWKTPLGKSPLWSGQMAGYMHLAREAGYPVEAAATLRLDPNGGTPKADYLEDETRAWAAFLGALCAQNYFGKETV